MTIPRRITARLIVLDAAGSVLLVRYREYRTGKRGFFWATPGGRLEEGESVQDAAARELQEETGLRVPVGEKIGVRSFTFELPEGLVDQEEHYFLVRVPNVAPAVNNSSAERIVDHRWWSIAELMSTTEQIYPEGLLQDVKNVLARSAA